jgi:hypothetical protein
MTTTARFILTYDDDNDRGRNARPVADGAEEAAAAVNDFIGSDQVWDEDLADELRAANPGVEQVYEDALRPAVEYLLGREGHPDLTALIAAMRVGEEHEVKVEGGTFQLYRDQ